MAKSLQALLLTLVCAAASGCSLARPNWLHPGPTLEQQQRAVLFDPYVDNDLGPEVVGVRPPGFQKSRAEPVRAKMYQQDVQRQRADPWRGTWWGR